MDNDLVHMKAKSNRIIGAVMVGLLIGGIIVALMPVVEKGYWEHRRMQARREWKAAALPEIARLVVDRDWLTNETTRLSAPGAGTKEGVIAPGWLSDHLILMGDGEWLIYKARCNKVRPHEVEDIFLAKGSDGKWYYSTCHFCVGMVCLLMFQQDEKPNDLAFFVRRYQLREFDGKSDDCLKKTKSFPANLDL